MSDTWRDMFATTTVSLVKCLPGTFAPLVSEAGPIDSTTGTRRLSLDRENAEGGAYGDEARGEAYVSRYASDDGRACATISVYPILAEWGWDVCEQSEIGYAVVDEDGEVRPDDCADITYDYPHALTLYSYEDARRIAERYGRRDYSFALYLRAVK